MVTHRCLKHFQPRAPISQGIVARSEITLLLTQQQLTDPVESDINGSLHNAIDLVLHSAYGARCGVLHRTAYCNVRSGQGNQHVIDTRYHQVHDGNGGIQTWHERNIRLAFCILLGCGQLICTVSVSNFLTVIAHHTHASRAVST